MEILGFVIPFVLFFGFWAFLLWRYKASGRAASGSRFGAWKAASWPLVIVWIVLLLVGLATREAGIAAGALIGLGIHLFFRFIVWRATASDRERDIT